MTMTTAIVRRFVLDVGAGLTIFAAFMIGVLGGAGPAGAGDTALGTLVSDKGLQLALLGCVFSLVLAFNLALYRHVRRVALTADGTPRGSVRRRGA